MPRVRLSPSGPELDVFEGLVEPGKVLGNPLTALLPAIASPLDGLQVGAILRFGGFLGMSLDAGQYDNLAIPDGIHTLDIDPVGGDVLITGLLWSGRGNPGAFLTLGKFGADSQVILVHNSSSSTDGNRIFTPNGVNYQMRTQLDTCQLWPFANRFQVIDRLQVPTGNASEIAPTGITALLGNTFDIRLTISAGTPGAPDDVTLFNANCPLPIRIMDAAFLTSTNIVGSTIQLRTASGGGGTALTTALSTAATGTARNNDTVTRTVAQNGSAFWRRSDAGVAGTAILTCVRS